jgi:hypothetical protein
MGRTEGGSNMHSRSVGFGLEVKDFSLFEHHKPVCGCWILFLSSLFIIPKCIIFACRHFEVYVNVFVDEEGICVIKEDGLKEAFQKNNDKNNPSFEQSHAENKRICREQPFTPFEIR